MKTLADPANRFLLDRYQRGFPLVSHPFARVGREVGLSEAQTLVRYRQMHAEGLFTRIGAIVAPNTIGASTLCAMKVPVRDLDRVAAIVSAVPGVNHNYEREGRLNLWFVLTAASQSVLSDTMQQIETRTGHHVRDLRMIEPYHLDLGFPVFEASGEPHKPAWLEPEVTKIEKGDHSLLAEIEAGLPFEPRPFAGVALQLGKTERQVIGALRRLQEAAIIRRFGVIVRHRKLGFRANAMAVWDIPDDLASRSGKALAAHPGVTLCYRRMRAEDWRFNVYCMVHGKSREETLAVTEELDRLVGQSGRDHGVLFSRRCFKQTGASFSTGVKAA